MDDIKLKEAIKKAKPGLEIFKRSKQSTIYRLFAPFVNLYIDKNPLYFQKALLFQWLRTVPMAS